MNADKLKTAAAFLLVLVACLAVNNVVMTRKITSRVMESIRREYVPGPYEPGFDPDKVPPRVSPR